jgi:hypothetical protein
LGARDDRVDRVEDAPVLGQQLGVLEQLLLGRLEEPAIARLELRALLEGGDERLPRVGRVAACSAVRIVSSMRSSKIACTSASPAREPAEHRRVADPRAARDLRHADVDALLGERLRRRLEDEAAVALGVRAERALPDVGHEAPTYDRLRRIDTRQVASAQQHRGQDHAGHHDRGRDRERELEALDQAGVSARRR